MTTIQGDGGTRRRLSARQRKENRKMQINCEAIVQAISRVETENDNLRQYIQQLQSEIQPLVDERNALQAKNAHLEAENTQLRAELMGGQANGVAKTETPEGVEQ